MYRKFILFSFFMLIVSSNCNACYKKRKLGPLRLRYIKGQSIYYKAVSSGYLKGRKLREPLKKREIILEWQKKINNKLNKLFGPKRREFEKRRDEIFLDSFGNNGNVRSASYSGKDINGYLKKAKKLFEDICNCNRIEQLQKCNNVCQFIECFTWQSISKLKNSMEPYLKEKCQTNLILDKDNINYKEIVGRSRNKLVKKYNKLYIDFENLITNKAKSLLSVKSMVNYVVKLEELKTRAEEFLDPFCSLESKSISDAHNSRRKASCRMNTEKLFSLY